MLAGLPSAASLERARSTVRVARADAVGGPEHRPGIPGEPQEAFWTCRSRRVRRASCSTAPERSVATSPSTVLRRLGGGRCGSALARGARRAARGCELQAGLAGAASRAETPYGATVRRLQRLAPDGLPVT